MIKYDHDSGVLTLDPATYLILYKTDVYSRSNTVVAKQLIKCQDSGEVLKHSITHLNSEASRLGKNYGEGSISISASNE
jgi:hypothetical protein